MNDLVIQSLYALLVIHIGHRTGMSNTQVLWAGVAVAEVERAAPAGTPTPCVHSRN